MNIMKEIENSVKAQLKANPVTNTLREKVKKKEHRCEVCGVRNPGVKLCSACQSVAYCGVDHQKEHWKDHKTMCQHLVKLKTFDLMEDEREVTGKYVVASKALERGALIWEECPIFQFSPTTEVTKSGQCVTCGIGIVGADDPKVLDKFRCSMCSWPVCSKKCEKHPVHAENECKVFVENDAWYPENKEERDDTIGDFVMIARGFSIRSQKPELWEEILDIMPMYTLDEFNGLDQRLLMNIMMKGKSITKMKSVFPTFLHDDEDEKIVEHEIRAQIMILARRVGYSINNDKDLNMDSARMYLYKKASYFSNSCVPNCFWEIGPFPHFGIRIRAALPIKKGDRLTVNRQGYLYWGTAWRQTLSFERYKRYCTCPLCSDPTECGTFQSAVTCPLCYKILSEKGERDPSRFGYLLPIPQNPADLGSDCHTDPRSKPSRASILMEEDASWICNRCQTPQLVSTFIDKLKELHQEVKTAKEAEDPAVIHKLVDKILREKSGPFIHPNHWIIQSAVNGQRLRNTCAFPSWVEPLTKEQVSEGSSQQTRKRPPIPLEKQKQEFEILLERCAYTLKILDKTCPGLQHERVRVLLMMADGLYNLSKSCCENNKEFKELPVEKVQELETRFKMVQKYFQESLVFWTGAFPPRGVANPVIPDYLKGRLQVAKQLEQIVQGHLALIYKNQIYRKNEGLD